MEFLLRLDNPERLLSGFTAHTATLIWENGHGNDCVHHFHKRDHVELMREVLAFIKGKNEQIVSLDLSQFQIRQCIILHTL